MNCFTPLHERLKKPKRFLKRVWDKETRRIVNAKDSNGRVQYMTVDQEKIDDVWSLPYLMPASRERVGYPTQKPLTLLDRIIKASSNEGDVVLDPFAGCATACVSAESLHRQWIGIDLSPLAAKLVKARLGDEFKIFAEIHHRTDVPTRTDLGTLPNYRTHRHTLYGRQEGHCAGCRVLFPFRNLTVDHVVPRAQGGSDVLDNLQLLCGACNSTKGTGTHAALLAALRQRGILTEGS